MFDAAGDRARERASSTTAANHLTLPRASERGKRNCDFSHGRGSRLHGGKASAGREGECTAVRRLHGGKATARRQGDCTAARRLHGGKATAAGRSRYPWVGPFARATALSLAGNIDGRYE